MKDLVESIALKLLKSYLSDERLDILKKELIAWMRRLAKSTDNQLDDAMVDIFERAIN